MKRSYIKGKERKTQNNAHVPLQLKAGELLVDVRLIGEKSLANKMSDMQLYC